MEKETKPKLISKCKELGIRNYSSKTKPQIIALLNAYYESVPLAEPQVPETKDESTLKFIDLFCGIGGLATPKR